MAQRAKRPCAKIGCPELIAGGTKYCDKHIKDARNYDKQRGTAAERGYDYRWSLIRLRFLAEHPLCYDCLNEKPEQITPAKEVHHILAKRKGGKDDYDNLMSLCRRHHSIRSLRGE